MPLRITVGSDATEEFEASCLSSVVVEDWVYSSGDGVVGKVDLDDRDKAPAVGIVVAKPSTTSCVVRTSGEVEISGLSAGALYYVGTDSRVLEGPPSRPLSGTRLVQPVGVATHNNRLQIQLKLPARIRPA